MAVFDVDCPCCRASLVVDAESKTVLSYTPGQPKSKPTDLFQEVDRIKATEQTRDKRFEKQLDVHRRQGAAMERRFDGLLKKAKDAGPIKPGLRDIDLD